MQEIKVHSELLGNDAGDSLTKKVVYMEAVGSVALIPITCNEIKPRIPQISLAGTIYSDEQSGKGLHSKLALPKLTRKLLQLSRLKLKN